MARLLKATVPRSSVSSSSSNRSMSVTASALQRELRCLPARLPARPPRCRHTWGAPSLLRLQSQQLADAIIAVTFYLPCLPGMMSVWCVQSRAACAL